MPNDSMSYPVDLRFKLLAISSQLSVTDANGRLVMYIKQKAFKLKEDITVFRDNSQAEPLFNLKADRVIDFSARYHITDSAGREVGIVKREGMKSLWKATFSVYDREQIAFTVVEAKPWIKVADAMLSEVPVLGMFTGYFFQPAYDLNRSDGTTVMRLEKQKSFSERHFRIEKLTDLTPEEETRALMGLIMTVLLERVRG